MNNYPFPFPETRRRLERQLETLSRLNLAVQANRIVKQLHLLADHETRLWIETEKTTPRRKQKLPFHLAQVSPLEIRMTTYGIIAFGGMIGFANTHPIHETRYPGIGYALKNMQSGKRRHDEYFSGRRLWSFAEGGACIYRADISREMDDERFAFYLCYHIGKGKIIRRQLSKAQVSKANLAREQRPKDHTAPLRAVKPRLPPDVARYIPGEPITPLPRRQWETFKALTGIYNPFYQ